MTFGASGYLAVVLAAGGAAFALAWLVRWRMSARRRFGGETGGAPLAYAAPLLLIAACALAAFAAARPQWGHDETTVEDRGIDLMVVLDVSNSMFADDVPPTRLRRAQDELTALMERMTGDRVGLIIFAGAPFNRSALTSDLGALQTIVGGVDEERGLMPPGSDLGAAIERAHASLLGGAAETKVMLIVSDGEDHGGGIAQAVSAARAAGIRVYAAGAGTELGSSIVDIDAETGVTRPRLDINGVPVTTRLDAAALEQIAASGGGSYVQLAGDGRPLAALASEFEGLESTTFATEETATPVEQFQIFAAIALAIVVAATLLQTMRWPSARRALRLWPVAGASVFIAGICAADAADVNRRGNRHYHVAEFGEAVASYRTAQALAPGESELFHNAGNALGRDGDFNAAIDETARGLPAEEDNVEAALEYALGNHYNGAQRLEDALEAYRRSLIVAPEDVDAKHNFELTARRLTPTPTPTEIVAPPELESSSTPDPTDPSGAGGTPGAAGTPEIGGTPQPGGEDIPPDQLERLLEEALAGIDEEFTVEEALRVLELLEDRNRDQLEEGVAGEPGLPDY